MCISNWSVIRRHDAPRQYWIRENTQISSKCLNIEFAWNIIGAFSSSSLDSNSHCNSFLCTILHSTCNNLHCFRRICWHYILWFSRSTTTTFYRIYMQLSQKQVFLKKQFGSIAVEQTRVPNQCTGRSVEGGWALGVRAPLSLLNTISQNSTSRLTSRWERYVCFFIEIAFIGMRKMKTEFWFSRNVNIA